MESAPFSEQIKSKQMPDGAAPPPPLVGFKMPSSPSYNEGQSSDTVAIAGLPNDDAPNAWAGFSDKAIRAAFVRKVYGILMIQLLFTLGLTGLFVFEKNTKRYIRSNIGWYYLAYIVFIVTYIFMVCSQNLRRKWPHNLIMLSIFTAAMSYMVATISAFHNTETVFIALGITVVVCLAVTLFSFYTKFDFTSWGGFLFVGCWVLLIFGFLCLFFPSKIGLMALSAAGALLFTLFLAYDTQLIIGGKKCELSPEEHIIGAIQLYLDVVYIFIYIMTLVGGGRR